MFKKLILTFGVIIILGIVAVAFFFSSLINKAVVEGVNYVGPKLTQTKVTLDSADISLFGGKGTLEGLFVGNPEGFSGDSALKLGKISVAVDLNTVNSDTVVIKEIYIKDPQVNFERTRSGSNLQALQKNIEAATGAGQKDSGETTGQGDGTAAADTPQQKVIIEHLVVEGGVVDVVVLGQKLTLPMPPLELNNIGEKEGGIDQAKAAALFMKELIGSIAKAVTEQVSDAGDVGREVGKQVEGVKEEAEKALEGLKKLF